MTYFIRGHMKKPARSSKELLAQIKSRIDLPQEPSQRETIERHYQSLEQLAQSLRTLGLNDQRVDEAVMDVFDEYEEQLRRYINSVKSP